MNKIFEWKFIAGSILRGSSRILASICITPDYEIGRIESDPATGSSLFKFSISGDYSFLSDWTRAFASIDSSLIDIRRGDYIDVYVFDVSGY